ncbi:MAG: NYN domain-containing protein [Nitrococcus sp.]|nr:NYN domain-containing protein [Nitrococcus sp.]
MHEEKETDVHLALRLLADAEDDVFDRAILLTADSDLVPVVRMIKQRHPSRHLTVAAPPGRFSGGRHLQKVADSYFELNKRRLARHLLPEKVVDSNGRIVAVRPASYAPAVS